MPNNQPPSYFVDLVNTYANGLRDSFSSTIPANPEDQLKRYVQNLLEGFTQRVHTITEAQVAELGARPDIGVSIRELLCGFVELKAPGKGARPNRFTGADKRQWEKFKALPNLIYTDGSEWTLYREGELTAGPIRLSRDLTQSGSGELEAENLNHLHALLLDFFHWEPSVPNSPKALATLLAPLCRLLRQQVEEAVSQPQSNLATLAQEWRRYLFPDADDHQFADAYAQTLTYSLLLARLSGQENLTTETAATSLDLGHGLLAQALRVLSQPGAREEIDSSVSLLERVIAVVNPGALRQKGDPWLYFYEDFLSEYDPVLRKKRGVYYTPMQVIKAKVRLVSELLSEHFDKPLSFADDGVVFLDPAAGTAAYPLAAIEYALEKVEQNYGQGMVAARATEAAHNTHAFEFLVGPYAVAHLRMTQLIKDAGGSLPPDGIHVYLTDTLESPNAIPPQPNLYARKLTEEHERAQNVKLRTPVLVCMGNPPYEREQREDNPADDERKGGWVRYGDRENLGNRPILLDFIEPAVAAGAGVHVKNLYNDYVYFWRWVLWKMFENPNAGGPGIVAFITASSYLRGPGFVAMRQKMRESFDDLWIIDLEGDNLGARKTENVFAIRTPVAIAIGIRYAESRPDIPASIKYTKIVGTREEKFERLEDINSFADLEWSDCYNGWMDPFLPIGNGDYFSWPLLTHLFPWQHSGSQYKRTWPIGENAEILIKRWETFVSMPLNERRTAFGETRDRKIDRQYESLEEPTVRLPALSLLDAQSQPLDPVRYSYRSFDRQWVLPDKRLGDYLKSSLWHSKSDRQIYLSSLLTKVLGLGPSAMVSVEVPDLDYFSGRGGKDIVPLFRDSEAQFPNLTNGLLDRLSNEFTYPVSPEDVFCYVYAVFATPSYVERFSEELTEPGPRIPFTKESALFERAVNLGKELIWIHTFGERFIPNGKRKGEIPSGAARCTTSIPTEPERYPEEYSYDPPSATVRIGSGIIGPVSDEIWNFEISGLRVVTSWLNYRMKKGAGRQRSVLDKIRPERWTAAMTQELLEILWVLEATLAVYPQLDELQADILSGDIFIESDFPQPTATERAAPREEADNEQITLFGE